jgi:hypothetical protein
MRRAASREGLKRFRMALRGPPGRVPTLAQLQRFPARQMVLGILRRLWLSASHPDDDCAADFLSRRWPLTDPETNCSLRRSDSRRRSRGAA